jgi:hypothetical protein
MLAGLHFRKLYIQAGMRALAVLFFILIFFSGIASAGDEQQINEQVEDELWRKSLSRAITPNRIEVADTNLLFNQRTYVRCLIAGLPTPSGEGYPREMTSKAIERIQELSF